MPVARVLSRAELGLDAPLVHVEVHLGSGLPAFSIVGLPAPVVRESRERVRAALLTSGYEFPARRITVNLAPVELSKQGGRFDLPIALGVLIASGQLDACRHEHVECYGELGLGGELKPVKGLFLAALQAHKDGHALIIPHLNLAEVALSGVGSAYGVEHLRAAAATLAHRGLTLEAHRSVAAALADVACVAGGPAASEQKAPVKIPERVHPGAALFDRIAGQWRAKRALAIAAAGGHSLLMIGPPGSGKSLLAACLPALLPPLSHLEALEVASIAALSGLAPDPQRWRQRPFRTPHHTASARAIVGGGTPTRPGEISLAHAGVLFLDELPEYDRRVLEALREPVEVGTISLARASGCVVLPARFQLIAAMNPCPCGYLGDSMRECRCTPAHITRYRQRISGPLLDRIDVRVQVAPLEPAELAAVAGVGDDALRNVHPEQTYARVAPQVQKTRALRVERSGAPSAFLPIDALQRCSALDPAAATLLERSCQRLALSGRAVQRILALSRTIADIAESDGIGPEHLAEAIQLRRPLELSNPRRGSELRE